jgi:hypothetical protein
MEEQPVHMFSYRGHIKVFSEAVYKEDQAAASASPTADLEQLEQAGMM